MRKPYPLGCSFRLLRADTFYPELDGGLAVVGKGVPVQIGEGQRVTVIDPGPLYAAYVRKGRLSATDSVLCAATSEGRAVYAWLALGWLEEIEQQGRLFETAQPSLF